MNSLFHQMVILACFMELFLGIHFLSQKKKPYALLFGLCMLSAAFHSLTAALQPTYPRMFFISFGNQFLSLSLLYLCVLSLGNARVFSKKQGLLFTPWLAGSLYKVYWLFQPEVVQYRYLASAQHYTYMLGSQICSCIFSLILLFLSLKHLTGYQKQAIITFRWLKQLVVGLLILNFIWLMHNFLLLAVPHHQLIAWIPLVSVLVLLVLACWIGLNALQSAAFFSTQSGANLGLLVTQEEQVIFDKLHAYLRESKAYTQPGLTMVSLSNELGIRQQTLSQAIKNCTNTNYYAYINDFRLEEFKQLLLSEMNQKFSIEGLAKQAGFGSKTTFYAFFKKTEGITPKEYAKKLSGSKIM